MLLDGPRLAPLSGSNPDALVVLIHGYGSNGDDLISLGAAMQPSLPGAAFVAPNAPSLIPFMANAHQWWAIETFSMAERTAGADAAAAQLDTFLSAELESAGLDSSRLLLVGFSQGTMMALHVGLRRAHPLAGIIGISGMLVGPERLQGEILSRPPVLLIHGTDDDVLPFQAMGLASASLEGAGVPVETHMAPGAGHWISPDGLNAAVAFASQVLSKPSANGEQSLRRHRGARTALCSFRNIGCPHGLRSSTCNPSWTMQHLNRAYSGSATLIHVSRVMSEPLRTPYR